MKHSFAETLQGCFVMYALGWLLGIALLDWGVLSQSTPAACGADVPYPVYEPVQGNDQDVQVQIAPHNRMRNRSRLAPDNPSRDGSQCVWVSLETLCRHHGVTQGIGISANRWHPTGPGESEGVLRKLGVPYKSVYRRDPAFLREWVTQKRAGVAYAVPGHMRICVHWDEQTKKAALIDNAGPRRLQVQWQSTDAFLRSWTGWAVAIVPQHAPPVPPAPPDPNQGWEPVPMPPGDPGRLYERSPYMPWHP